MIPALPRFRASALPRFRASALPRFRASALPRFRASGRPARTARRSRRRPVASIVLPARPSPRYTPLNHPTVDIVVASGSYCLGPYVRAQPGRPLIDHPDDPDVPPDEHADRPPIQGGDDSGRASPRGGAKAETRNRQEYYVDLRTAVSAEESVAAQRTSDGEQAAAEKWDETAEESRSMWTEYRRRWPPEERPPLDRSGDPPGSWRGDGKRTLDCAANSRVEAACDRVAEREHE